jgi:hypothetical protein
MKAHGIGGPYGPRSPAEELSVCSMPPRALEGVEGQGADKPAPLSTMIGVTRRDRGWFGSVAPFTRAHDLVRLATGDRGSVDCKLTAARGRDAVP